MKATASRVTPPLKYHGGKWYLAAKIVALMPPHIHYVEPYAGGLSVLLAKNPEGISEVVNDLNGRLTNFWRQLQGPNFVQFLRVLQCTPFSETEWQDAGAKLDDPNPLTAALAFFVRVRQSLAGRMNAFAPL